MEILSSWIKQENRKPLILRGPRQVGKSWLVQELGKYFDNFVEINFEMTQEIGFFFEGNLDPEELIKNISNYLKVKIVPGKTLLFFDEIQQIPRAITSLRYFYEKIPELHVIAAGSLLEFELRNISIPVGRVSFIYVYPLSFGEYLTASNNE
ncbi:MAG: AAA family ATPase, partial [Calditrichales bacterium]|nr:AAA family ATPase [Calditrichales bacterium]